MKIPRLLRQSKRAGAPAGRMARREERAAYLFLSPWLIGLVVFLLGPIIASILISMTHWSIVTTPRWVGLANYERMLFDDPDFWRSIKVTAKYAVWSVPVYMVAGVALSLLLNLHLKGMHVFRTILYLPAVLSGVAVAVLWVRLLNPDLGVINTFLRGIGVANPPRWLNSPTWAVPSVVLMRLWGVGGGAIIFLAGHQNIPPHLYEAAEIDGAGSWRKFVYVTLPLLTPTLFFTLITGLIGAFQVFAPSISWLAVAAAEASRCSSMCSTCTTRASAAAGWATPPCWRGCSSSWPPSSSW